MVLRYFGLHEIGRMFEIVRFHGGWWRTLRQMYRIDDAKIGTLIGTDKFGNKYYENNLYFHGRNRWVDYNENLNLEYDGSQVPPEWHRWLHYVTDDPPTKMPPVQHRWMVDHVQNLSGTSAAFTPYTTTRPKVQSWVPPKK